MTRFFVGLVVLVALETVTAAQAIDQNGVAISNFDPDNAVAPVSSVEGPGVKIGEGTVLRPVFGVETGYVSNVFYEDSNTHGAGLLRLLAQVGTGSLSNDRLAGGDPDAAQDKGAFQYRADVRATYDLLFAGTQAVSDQGGLGLGASLHGLVNPMGSFSLGIDEDFVRLIRATNYETDANTNRDLNNFGLRVLYHPQEHSIGGWLYYNNTIDIFERSTQSFSDRMMNQVGIHPTWQWLPQTQVYADISEAVVTGIGTTAGVPQKVTSYPFTAIAGLATLFTLKTTFNIYAGYTNGFYSAGPSFSAPKLGATLGYRYSPLGRVSLTYALQYQDSVNANFYRDHVLQLSLQHAINPILFMIQPEVHFREYSGVNVVMGPATRDDTILAVVAGAQYNFRNWIAASLNYRFTTVQTDYRYMPLGGGPTDDPSYVRHELLLGLRVAM